MNMRTAMKSWAMAISLMILGGGLSGCSAMNWKEEVLLHNGKKLVVERLFHLGGYPEIAGRERQALDETVAFIHPETGQMGRYPGRPYLQPHVVVRGLWKEAA